MKQPAMARYIGIDVGAESIKVAELTREGKSLRWTRRHIAEHHKNPSQTLLGLLRTVNWERIDGAAVCGRLSRQVSLLRVPAKQAQAAGVRFLHGTEPVSVVSIGSHGFSVLELRAGGIHAIVGREEGHQPSMQLPQPARCSRFRSRPKRWFHHRSQKSSEATGRLR